MSACKSAAKLPESLQLRSSNKNPADNLGSALRDTDSEYKSPYKLASATELRLAFLYSSQSESASAYSSESS